MQALFVVQCNLMICSKCTFDKLEEEFSRSSRNKRGRADWCKLCHSAWSKEHYKKPKRRADLRECATLIYKRNAQYIWDYLLRNPCISCGEKDPVVLDFHHRDAAEKEYNISKAAANGFKITRIDSEIRKCDVLCANCHRRESAKQFGWYKYITTGP